MTSSRGRNESGESNCSLTNMSVSDDDLDSGFKEPSFIITNYSYLQTEKTTESSEVKPSSTESCLSDMPQFSPISNTSLSPTTSNSSIKYGDLSTVASLEIASLLNFLGITTTNQQNCNNNDWFNKLCTYLASILKRTPPEQRKNMEDRLKRHMHLKNNGQLYVSLVGASILNIHPDLQENRVRSMTHFPKMLPHPIREKIAIGKFIPIRHMIYGEALMEGAVTHIKDGIEVAPEPYPLNVVFEPPPISFIQKIRRPDILRCISSHSLLLAYRFSKLAASMHNILREVWILLYRDLMNVDAVMDIYDQYFMEFEKQVCLLKLMPMDKFPPYLVESIKAKYLPSVGIHSKE